MPFPLLLLLIATLLPLAGSAGLLLMGRRMGAVLSGYVAVFFMALSFACSGWAILLWLGGGNYHGLPFGPGLAPIHLTWNWLPPPIARGHPLLRGAVYVDSLAIGASVTLTLTALLVQIFAARSMRRDPRFARFFSLLLLAVSATLALLLSGTLLQSALLLELVGICAAMLIRFRADRRASGWSPRMFVVARLGDVGLGIGIWMLAVTVGNLDFVSLWMNLGGAAHGPLLSSAGGVSLPAGWLTAAGIALFFGAAARCAQFPLQVWATDAAEALAPAAATIFWVTLGFAAVFFLARLFPLLTPSARLLAAIVGATTLAMAALIAAVQTDLKKVLAWAAVSQLSYLVLALGVGSWTGAMFHLTDCVFIGVLLFLVASAVVRAGRGQTDLWKFGGLLRRMPVTGFAAALGILALCGIGWHGIALCGYFSRNLILTHAALFCTVAHAWGRSGAYWMLLILPAAVVPLTGFYLTRWWMLLFAGAPRDRRLHEHAREVSVLFWVMVVLVVLSALAGKFLGVREMAESAVAEARRATAADASVNGIADNAATHVFDAAWSSSGAAEPTAEELTPDEPSGAAPIASASRIEQLVDRWAAAAALLGMLISIVIYRRGGRWAGRLSRIPPLSWGHAWLSHQMYFEELYDTLLVAPVVAAARPLAWLQRQALAAGKIASHRTRVRVAATAAGARLWFGSAERMRMLRMLLVIAAAIGAAVIALVVAR